MFKLGLLLTIGIAASHASTIDSGNVFTRPYSVSSGTPVAVNFSSTDGNFSLFGPVFFPGFLNGGGNLICSLDPFPGCLFGQTYSIQAFFPDASSFPAQATAIINGIPMGTVLLGCLAPGCPHTFVSLIAQPVDISLPGDYVVPFFATGLIQASQGIGTPLILDQAVSGVGSLYFSVSTSSPGHFVVDTGFSPDTLGLRWNFVPEPSMFLPSLLGLGVIQWRQRRVKG